MKDQGMAYFKKSLYKQALQCFQSSLDIATNNIQKL